MATVRKLQAEIDKTFRKVDEQQEVFQQIFDRLHECDQSLKEKYEVCFFKLNFWGKNCVLCVALLARAKTDEEDDEGTKKEESRVIVLFPLLVFSAVLLCAPSSSSSLSRVHQRTTTTTAFDSYKTKKTRERVENRARRALVFSLSLSFLSNHSFR
jgi:hypothetical protein